MATLDFYKEQIQLMTDWKPLGVYKRSGYDLENNVTFEITITFVSRSDSSKVEDFTYNTGLDDKEWVKLAKEVNEYIKSIAK